MSADDDDMGSLYRAWDQAKQAKRRSNLESSTDLLVQERVPFTSHNNGVHLVVKSGAGPIDFWPSTGLWRVQGANRGGRGVRRLLAFIKERA